MQMPEHLTLSDLDFEPSRVTMAIGTGNHAVVGQAMVYEMLIRCKEYPPQSLADAMYIAKTAGEMLEAVIPGATVYVQRSETSEEGQEE